MARLRQNSEFGVTTSVELLPNGTNIAVTKENRIQYIYLVANYRLNVQIKKQSEALFEGVAEMIDQKWLRCVHLVAAACSSEREAQQ